MFGIDDIFFYQVVIGIAVVAIVTLVYVLKNRGGYFAVILKKQTGGYAKITAQRFLPTDKHIQFGKKTFVIDLNNMGFRDDTARFLGAKFIFYIDYASSKQMSFVEYKAAIDAEDLDLMVSRNIISQLVARLSTVTSMNLILILLGVGMGIAVGFIIGHYVGVSPAPYVPPTNQTVVP